MAIFGLFKSKKEKGSSKNNKNSQNRAPVSPYAGVKIICSAKSACDAVREISEKHFLSREAPFLPLESCSHRSECRCRYQHMKDRRVEPRRSADFGLPGKTVAVEKRQRRDRRVAEFA